LNITEVHSHSLVDFVPEMPTYLINVIKALGAYSEVNLHDYKVICPRLNLADENGLYCGEPAEAECNRCLLERGSDFQVFDIQTWRSKHKQALLTADKVLVPDQDMAERLPYYFPEVHFEVSPHEDIALESVRVQIPLLQPQEKLRVVVIGAIGKLKGFHVLISCAKNAQQYNLPIEFIVMGYGMNDKLMEEAGIYVMGKYQEHEALEKLNNLNPHVVWLPSLWPETYSYTLSLALKASLPVFAFDIGAIAHRLKRASMGEMLMDLSLVDTPSAINSYFEKFRDSCLELVNKK
jgi:glycosyltransferase involved in cell wall biosynthesis